MHSNLTPATVYAASYIVEAPAHTLESITAELLPLAQAAGFESLTLSQTVSTTYGAVYAAHGLMNEAQNFACTTLASSAKCHTMEAMRESAQETLYAIAGRVVGSL